MNEFADVDDVEFVRIMTPLIHTGELTLADWEEIEKRGFALFESDAATQKRLVEVQTLVDAVAADAAKAISRSFPKRVSITPFHDRDIVGPGTPSEHYMERARAALEQVRARDARAVELAAGVADDINDDVLDAQVQALVQPMLQLVDLQVQHLGATRSLKVRDWIDWTVAVFTIVAAIAAVTAAVWAVGGF